MFDISSDSNKNNIECEGKETCLLQSAISPSAMELPILSDSTSVIPSSETSEIFDISVERKNATESSVLNLILTEVRDIREVVHVLKTQIQQNTDKIRSVEISLDTLCDTTKAIASLVKNKKEKYGKTKADNFDDAESALEHIQPPFLPHIIGDNEISPPKFTDISNNTISDTRMADILNNNISDTRVVDILNNVEVENATTIVRPPKSPVTKPKIRRNKNKCAKFIKSELGKQYSLSELATSSLNGGTRVSKNGVSTKKALSPRRLKEIMMKARKNWRQEFENMKDMNEVINSKCRKAAFKVRKLKSIDDEIIT